MIFFQPAISAVSLPNFDFRVGADFRISPLGVARRTGAPDSSITATSIAGMVEGTYLPHRHFGIGLNLAVGYMGLSSSNADVGAPYSATFDFGQQGGAYVGAQLFLTSWNQALRLGVSVDSMPGGFGLPTGTPSPDVHTVMDRPMVTLFAGVDLIGSSTTRFRRPLSRSRRFPRKVIEEIAAFFIFPNSRESDYETQNSDGLDGNRRDLPCHPVSKRARAEDECPPDSDGEKLQGRKPVDDETFSEASADFSIKGIISNKAATPLSAPKNRIQHRRHDSAGLSHRSQQSLRPRIHDGKGRQ